MQIEMKTKIQGSRNGVRWPDAGGVVDLPDTEALELLGQGLAKPVHEEAERATAPEPERKTAAKKRG